MQLEPYIFFYGRCEEALEFYKSAIGGTYDLQRIADSPIADQFPSASRKSVMHASFKGDGISFMAADGRESKSIDPDAGNITLSLASDDAAEGERVFKALADGGKIVTPLEQAFWGGRFGTLVDRFGIEWMVTTR